MCIFFSKYVWNNKIEKKTNKIKNIKHMKKNRIIWIINTIRKGMVHEINQKIWNKFFFLNYLMDAWIVHN